MYTDNAFWLQDLDSSKWGKIWCSFKSWEPNHKHGSLSVHFCSLGLQGDKGLKNKTKYYLTSSMKTHKKSWKVYDNSDETYLAK